MKFSNAVFIDLPCLDYQPIWQLQQHLVTARKNLDFTDDIILFVEHAPVFTLGKHADFSNLRVSRDFLKQKNIELVKIERGGDITYHGPGQIVAYPLLNLNEKKIGVAHYVECLENIMIQTAGEYGIQADRDAVNRGVYIGNKKLGSVGISVRKGITFHGLALNVNVSLEPFSWIHPCGFKHITMTSIQSESNMNISMADVLLKIKHYAAKELDLHPRPVGFNDFIQTYLPGVEKELQLTKLKRKPVWLKKRLPAGATHEKVRNLIHRRKLNTVCQEAKCPNQFECFSNQTATFLILGDRCTRNCRFCAIETGPKTSPDPGEPERVAQSAKAMNLNYVVVTSVTRDDLPDGGASVFADTIRELRKKIPGVKVEVLIPDFQGHTDALETVLDAEPNVLNHNIETVPRLYASVRPEAVYERSLALFRHAAHYAPKIPVKSGLMLGLGETADEIEQVLSDVLSAGCSLLTLGQYLQPTKGHAEVRRFIPPEEFDQWRKCALEIGFLCVSAGPFVRSSYKAEEMLSCVRPEMANLSNIFVGLKI